MSKKILVCLFLISQAIHSTAQVGNTLIRNLCITYPDTQGYLQIKSALKNKLNLYPPLHTIVTLDKAVRHTALFCKIEDQIHQRHNIWLKIRAGDDSYRQHYQIRTSGSTFPY